jgi:hypothetical protein
MTGRAQVIEVAGFWSLERDFPANRFEDSLESQAVILLARADGAGGVCDATTRATGDQ